MVTLDYAAFLIAGIVGVFYDTKIAWGVVAVWALFKLLKVI